ncbi:MAG: oxidoreductase, partial [Planctomycetales bacterium]|nr:oxidoreductase [Planctomycetales bacterium]
MTELHFPWLEATVAVPLFGAVYLSRLKSSATAYRHSVALTLATLAIATGAWLDFLGLHTFESHDVQSVVQRLFGEEFLVVDELSAPLLPLAALLYAMTIISTMRTKINRFSFAWTLCSEAILLATFSCRQPWALITLLALGAIPPWIEIRSRGYSTRIYSLHAALFVGLLAIGWWLTATFPPQSDSTSMGALVGGCMLLLAAALRGGISPLHIWITDLFQKATFGSALLYVTPMTGAYAIMRLVFPISPAWVLQGIAFVSLATAVYTACLALVERDARRFFCYVFLSHSSLVLVGLELVNPIGLTGALCVWLSASLSLGAFGLTLRAI